MVWKSLSARGAQGAVKQHTVGTSLSWAAWTAEIQGRLLTGLLGERPLATACRTLAALASVAATPPAGGVPHDPRHQPAAEATLLAVLSALRQWASGMPPVCPRVLGTEAELLVVEEAERACAEAGFVAGLSYGAEAVAQRRAGGGAAEGGTQEGRSLQSLIEARALFQVPVRCLQPDLERWQRGLECRAGKCRPGAGAHVEP